MKKKGAFIGIDPGKKGAAALWSMDGRVEIHDYTNGEGAVVTLKRWHTEHVIQLAALEMPQLPPKFSTVANRELMRNAGFWEGALSAIGIKHIVVSPNQWKRIIPPLPIKSQKKRAIAYCCMKFKGIESLMSRVKDADRAEALLLALYAYDWVRFK
jgi:crossover junction endodeoxyribonuclease RuvC